MKDLKYVTWRNLKIGDKVEEWRDGNIISGAVATVKDVNPAYVTLSVFDRYDKQINSESTMFGVVLTEKEYHAKYLDGAKEVVKALHNKIAEYEAGYHEMWNSWIDHDPFAMAKACKENNMKIIGYVELAVPKTSFFLEKYLILVFAVNMKMVSGSGVILCVLLLNIFRINMLICWKERTMANCVTCDAICDRAGQHHVKTDCVSYVPKDYPKPRTNADKIRAKTDEELAWFYAKKIASCYGCESSTMEDCARCWLDWLKKEADI